MDGAGKKRLVKKKPATVKKKPGPRNPLQELNGGDGGGGGGVSFPLPRGSSEAQKDGCFRFISASDSSKSVLRKPKSAPSKTNVAPANSTNPLRVCPFAGKNQLRPGLQNTKQLELTKTRDLLLERGRRRKPPTENASVSKNPVPELGIEMNLCENGEQVGILQSGSRLASTPEKTLHGFEHEVGFDVKEEEKKLSNTPTSATTPPIQTSISPEIVNVPSVAPTPVCFAAGHLLVGVEDRRKCRPRGILTVGGAGMEVREDSEPKFRGVGSDVSGVSSIAPPLAGASMHWLSSPSKDANVGSSGSSCSGICIENCHAEASVNWLLSNQNDADEMVLERWNRKPSALVTKLASDHDFWGLSPLNDNSLGCMRLCSPFSETPSSGYEFRRTPTSDSSTSPFSVIIQRVAASSGLADCPHPEMKGRYHCVSSTEESPFSVETWGDGNIVSSPSSSSKSRRNVRLNPSEMGSMVEVLGTVNLPAEPKLTNDESFQFRGSATPSNSINQSREHCLYSKTAELCPNKQNLPDLEVRISWREGLVSRIFDMGELNCCGWLSDDEGDDNPDPELSFNFYKSSRDSLLREGNMKIADGFGSFEFACDNVSTKMREGKVPPPSHFSCAESTSTEGIDGLTSSGDSDWTLFYKNHLFEL